jgi:hypothetical protein
MLILKIKVYLSTILRHMKLQNNMEIKRLEEIITSQKSIKIKDNFHHNSHILKE